MRNFTGPYLFSHKIANAPSHRATFLLRSFPITFLMSVTDVRDDWYNSVHLTCISPASVKHFTHLFDTFLLIVIRFTKERDRGVSA